MFERYNEKARRVIFYARYFACDLGYRYIEPEHILLAILQEDPDLFRTWLKTDGDYVALKTEVTRKNGPKAPASVDIPLSQSAKRVLAFAAEKAELLQHRDIRPFHLLAGLLREEETAAAGVLRKYGVDDLDRSRIVFVASSDGHNAHKPIDSADLHKMIDQLPSSQLGRARALLQALLEANRAQP